MKIIYLSNNMSTYKGALYQRDIMVQFNRSANTLFYGPGYKDFNPNEDLNTTIKKIGGADLIIVGHSWLKDSPSSNIDPYPKLFLENSPIPKVMILNKEYTNLKQKLEWISKKNFCLGFSHHHDVDFYSKETKVPFKFVPLAFNEDLFVKSTKIEKNIDFAFCGLLKNNLKETGQTDARILTMKKLFYCMGDIPFFKKSKYKKYEIFWNSIPRNFLIKNLARVLNRYRFLSNEEYATLQLRSRAFLNTLSPLGIVSTRFFENMASRTLVFCEMSKNVKRIFPSECYLTFESDFSDFDQKFEMAVSDSTERSNMIKTAFELAYTQHTWKIRVSSMINTIESFV